MSAPPVGPGVGRPGPSVISWVPAVPGLPVGDGARLLGGAEGRSQPPAVVSVDLWTLPEAEVPGFAERLGGIGVLAPEERHRMARFRSLGARRRYLGGRLLARHALSQVAGGDPADWRFLPGPHGKPRADPAGPHFNVSHTAGMVACVVSAHHRCGVDVERTRMLPEALTALSRHLAPAERDALAEVPPERRSAEAAAYWVLKEAYLKGLGVGLLRALDSFAFTPPHRAQAVVCDPPERARHDWQFDLLYPGPDHVVAAAVESTRPIRPRLTRLSADHPDLPTPTRGHRRL
ncbi:4'-phosphopantetheinyl transferase superfamily protein [Streptomyces sp. PT12]|uniref:4'-phosphopantetheinyl transferase family protein n=1 Tax=Streptomyces sp. PT12 TaxID=1510197 RepID=UPI000DE46CC5|nr:4'-phosphopantetheinyl transferase superfamily protein [Streptomyces sp. PT12]RBM20681.1 4-phosphopantetheinyl transferase [Streptomyces sp. PT12]